MALSGVYKLFDQENDVVKNIKATISSGVWSGGSGTLTTFFSQSAQSSSTGNYYYDVYKTSPATDTEAEVQFSVAYGHIHGSGSKGTVGAATGNRASAAIHAQITNLVLPPNTDRFTYAGSVTSKHFYAVSIKRARMREKIDPGNWELHLSASVAAQAGAKHSATNRQLKLIDDSDSTTNPESGIGGRVFNIVSGSISTGTADINTAAASEALGGIGLFYPDLGLFIFNASVIEKKLNPAELADMFTVETGSNVHNTNAEKFFDEIVNGAYFQARREEKLSSTHFFCRAGNKEFNFSNNPTFFTASTGDFVQPTFFKDPKTFITTVGMFNNSNELLAVAKLSQPVLKSFSREALIKVKLDF